MDFCKVILLMVLLFDSLGESDSAVLLLLVKWDSLVRVLLVLGETIFYFLGHPFFLFHMKSLITNY